MRELISVFLLPCSLVWLCCLVAQLFFRPPICIVFPRTLFSLEEDNTLSGASQSPEEFRLLGLGVLELDPGLPASPLPFSPLYSRGAFRRTVFKYWTSCSHPCLPQIPWRYH